MFYRPRPGGFAEHGMGLLGWLIPLLLFAVLIAVVVYLAIRLTSHRGPFGPAPAGGPVVGGPFAPGGPFGPVAPFGPGAPRFGPDPAVEHARLRYARGEISREDYQRLLEDLGWSASAAPPPGPGPGPAAPPPPAPAPPSPPPPAPTAPPGWTPPGPAGGTQPVPPVPPPPPDARPD